MAKRIKLNEYLINNNILTDKEINSQILSGNVISKNKKFKSANEMVYENEEIYLKKPKEKYVSRGGDKIASAFFECNLSATNKSCLDCGASTGGFTDFLLQNGAKSVVTLDVNYGMLASKLRQDFRVKAFERINIKELTPEKLKSLLNNSKNDEQLSTLFDLIVADLSFISLRHIIPVISQLLSPEGEMFLLFKPQFEAYKDEVPPGGIINSMEKIEEIISRFISFLDENDYCYLRHIPSKVKGAKGNQEYFFLIKK